MNVSIVDFPETKVAAISYIGPPSREHETVRRLIDWRLEHGLLDQAIYRSYGLHYVDAKATIPSEYRVDFCLSYDGSVEPNDYGIEEKTIPAMRCAMARDVGSRLNNQAARYLFEEWLPQSGEEMDAQPVVFHYVNVGPKVKDDEAITDVYLISISALCSGSSTHSSWGVGHFKRWDQWHLEDQGRRLSSFREL